MSTLLKSISSSRIITRTVFRPSKNIPYYGLYRTEGETVQQDELLVSQRNFDYHPGANVSNNFIYKNSINHIKLQVYHVNDRGCNLIKAACDGKVMITREKVEIDLDDPRFNKYYGHRDTDNLYKLTYNILPSEMSQKFKLVDEVQTYYRINKFC